MQRELKLDFPDDRAGEEIEIIVEGYKHGDVKAKGLTRLTPERGKETVAKVSLGLLHCGAACTVVERRCDGDAVELCRLGEWGCPKWVEERVCNGSTPECEHGACVAEDVDGGIADAARRDSGLPDGRITRPDASIVVVDAAVSDGGVADMAKPDAVRSDTQGTDTARPDAAGPDAARTDAARPDVAQPDTYVCQPETDAQLCAGHGAACGSLSVMDRCGQGRSVASCGNCALGEDCDANRCELNGLAPGQPCTEDSECAGGDAALCGLDEAGGYCLILDCAQADRPCPDGSVCSEYFVTGSNCVEGPCAEDADCPRHADEGYIYDHDQSCWWYDCRSESDSALCAAAGRECGNFTTTDRCGERRSVSCGSCCSGTCNSSGQCVDFCDSPCGC